MAPSTGKPAVRNSRVVHRCGVKSNASSPSIQARPSLACAHSHKVQKTRSTTKDCFRRFHGVARQAECGGKIISPSDGKNAQEDVSPKGCICQRLKRSVSSHRKQRILAS